VENTGYFPKAISANGDVWLQHDKNDEWFVMWSGSTCNAFNARTGVTQSRSSGANEGYLEHNGQYVAWEGGSGGWNLPANTATSSYASPFAHVAALRGRFFATNWNASQPFRNYWVAGSGGSENQIASGPGANVHSAGQWVQDDAADDMQYAMITNYDTSLWGSGQKVYQAVAFVRLDGAVRLLAHTYSLGLDYWTGMPRGTISPDGKIVIFDSNMRNQSGRADLFVVEVPVR
jgi:hypothetical protein